jgi:hypothetical protein
VRARAQPSVGFYNNNRRRRRRRKRERERSQGEDEEEVVEGIGMNRKSYGPAAATAFPPFLLHLHR